MKISIGLVLFIILLSAGCTTYDVKRTPEGAVDIHVSSTRDLEQPELHYVREGDDAKFDFKAASIDNNTDAMLGMFQGMMGMMMQMMQQMMSMGIPVTIDAGDAQ